MPPHKKRYRKSFYILTPLLALLIMLAAIELILAIFFPVPFASEVNMYYEPDAFVGYRIRPHQRGSFFDGIPANANEHGHRDDETTLAKPPGTFRILLLGDSFTMAANVRREQGYADVLESLLNENRAGRVEVINAGVGGWDTFQYAQYFQHYGVQFDPDLVVIGFFVGNDAYDPMKTVDDLPTAALGRRVFKRRGQAKVTFSTKLRIFIYEHSHLVRLIRNRNYYVITEQEIELPPQLRDTDHLTPRSLKMFKSRLKNHLRANANRYRLAENSVDQVLRIKRLADEKSIPTHVVLIPDELQINATLREKVGVVSDKIAIFDFDMPQKMLIEMLKKIGVPSIHLLPFFRSDERRLYMNDTHWNAEGHRLAATVIAELLKDVIDERQSSDK